MSPRLRVLWISPKLPLPLLGGDKIRQYNLIRWLADRHAIHLVSFLERPEDRDHVPALAGICERVTVIPLPPRRTLIARTVRALHPRLPFYVNRYESAALREVIAQALHDGAPDVVEIEHIYMAPYFESVPAGTDVARVLTLHNIESALTARCADVERHPLKRIYWRLESSKLAALERHWLPRVDAVVVVSPHDRMVAAGIAPGARLYTVENAVDTEAYHVGADSARTRSVVFTGSLGYPPNADAVDFFLRAVWPRVRAAVPDAEFSVVGRDPSPALRARHGRDGVVVTGAVPDVRPYLARAAAVVVPLRAGSGTRLKILEAMATSTAIVSTRLGAEGLEVRDGADLLLADDPDAFARATITVLRDPEVRRRLGVNGRRVALARYDCRFAAAALERVWWAARPGRQSARHHRLPSLLS